MTLSQRVTLATAMATTLFLASAAQLGAWEPNDDDLDKAIASANFTAYFENATAWLNEQAPVQADQAAWLELLEKPVFRSVLDQRQLIAKCGLNQLAAFAQADSASSPKEFLRWLLKNTAAMDLYLEGAVPLGWAARERNDYTLNTAALEIWKQILAVDPDAKEGLPLKLAIATALAPPGSGAPGAGHSKPAVDPVERYKHFKTAHRNKELVPSFDALSVWEYQKVVQSGASNEDLAWGRKMINDWRPDLLIDEMVVNSTSFVWRRNAPPQYYPFKGMRDVMAGGGKCGPRSSWSVFICQACGVPAIGVGQPAHACVAYKAANPQTEPQPGSAWKVGFGRGGQVSKLENMSGPEFLAAVEDRSRRAEFSQIEHLRWLAAALTPAEKAGPVLEIARGIQASRTAVKTDLTASLKAEEAKADLGAKAATAQAAALQTNPTNPRATEPNRGQRWRSPRRCRGLSKDRWRDLLGRSIAARFSTRFSAQPQGGADAAADFFPTADEESVGGLQHSGAAGRHLLGCHDGCLCQRQSEAGNLCGQRCVGHGCDSADAWPVSRNATGRIKTRKGSADAAPTDLAHRAHAGHRPAIV